MQFSIFEVFLQQRALNRPHVIVATRQGFRSDVLQILATAAQFPFRSEKPPEINTQNIYKYVYGCVDEAHDGLEIFHKSLIPAETNKSFN